MIVLEKGDKQMTDEKIKEGYVLKTLNGRVLLKSKEFNVIKDNLLGHPHKTLIIESVNSGIQCHVRHGITEEDLKHIEQTFRQHE
jgi:hypothetical protein